MVAPAMKGAMGSTLRSGSVRLDKASSMLLKGADEADNTTQPIYLKQAGEILVKQR